MNTFSEKYCDKGDLLYAWSASFGPKIWDGERVIFHYHIWNIKYGMLNRDFVYYFLMADTFNIHNDLNGTTMKHLSMENMIQRIIPLPPLTEQQQIVAKLNQLLTEIDELKAQEQALLATQNAFPKKLRAAILQAAIQGELNERTNENARDLLAAIQTEKAALQKTGKLKKDKPLATISEEEIPFAIPENWVWVRQQELCWLDNGQKHSGESLPYLEARVIRGSKEPEYKNSGILVEKNVQVILVDGENSGEIMLTPFRGYLGSTFKVLGKTSLIDEKFLMYLFLLNQRTYRENKRGAAIPHLDKDLFKNKLVPLPPPHRTTTNRRQTRSAIGRN